MPRGMPYSVCLASLVPMMNPDTARVARAYAAALQDFRDGVRRHPHIIEWFIFAGSRITAVYYYGRMYGTELTDEIMEGLARCIYTHTCREIEDNNSDDAPE